MAAGAVTPQVQIPPVVLGVQPQLGHARLQHVDALLALGPADDLPDAGHQAVGGGHGPAVVVQAHIERLNILGIVGDKHRLFEHLLGEVALVLRLEVAPPLHLVVKLFVVLFQQLNGLSVAHPGKVGGGHVPEPLHQPLVHKGVEEGHLVGALVHHGVDDVLNHGLGHVHVVTKVGERHLGLNHPELGGVALGIGVLRPECGPKGIYASESHGEILRVELAGHGEVGMLAEEILGEVNGAVLFFRRVAEIQGGHLEHLAGPFAIAGGNDGGVNVDEAPVLEEAVDGVGSHAAHPEGGGEQVGAGTQVLDGAQVLHAVALLLQGVVRGGGALHRDGGSLHLQGLLGPRRERHRAGDHESRAHILSGDLFIVVQRTGVHDDLEVFETGAVVELNEAEGFQIPDGAGPAHDSDRPTVQAFAIGKDGGDGDAFHIRSLNS